jgi:hypothetical protein
MLGMTRLTGICSTVGGISWTAGCFVHNSLPQGCIDAACADSLMRGSTPAGLTLFALAGLMLAASGFGLLMVARQRTGPTKIGLAAGVVGALGLFLLLAAGVISTFVDNDWNGMPGLVVPGVLLLAIGLIFIAVLVLRGRIVPTWLSALMLATAVLLPFANEQTSRILLAVPFGVTWLFLGLDLLRHSADVSRTAAFAPKARST